METWDVSRERPEKWALTFDSILSSFHTGVDLSFLKCQCLDVVQRKNLLSFINMSWFRFPVLFLPFVTQGWCDRMCGLVLACCFSSSLGLINLLGSHWGRQAAYWIYLSFICLGEATVHRECCAYILLNSATPCSTFIQRPANTQLETSLVCLTAGYLRVQFPFIGLTHVKASCGFT